jgi:hypothetical protein
LIEGVVNADLSLPQDLKNARRGRHDDVPANRIVFVRPVSEIQFALGVPNPKNPWPVELVQHLVRLESRKTGNRNRLAWNTPHVHPSSWTTENKRWRFTPS